MNKLKKFDKRFLSDSVKTIAGIDEAGRGPLAGPVVAAAVIFDNDVFIAGVDDSKKLSAKKREALFEEIISKAVCVRTSIVEREKIDEINILQASLLAMKNCYEALNPQPDIALVDGNKIFPLKNRYQTVVKGDSKSFSIAAASIVAKVTRDRLMIELSEKHPEYKWHKNKGYGTREHIEAIKKYGATEHHRLSFLGKILEANVEYSFGLNG